MIGFGSVGREFCKMLLEQGDEVSINAISTRSKGTLLDPKGVNISRALEEIDSYGRFSDNNPQLIPYNSFEAIENSQANVLVELSTLSIEDGEPAITHIEPLKTICILSRLTRPA